MSDQTPRIRTALQSIPSYKPGKPPAARAGQTSFKMSSNENPYPPLPSVLHVVEGAALQMNRYPDMFAVEPSDAALDAAFERIRASGAREVIVDLRYNGGGLLSVARTQPAAMSARRSMIPTPRTGTPRAGK